ncbi:hypothetical protein B0H21DRAFT_713571 [Amylocystis lapponica]|nr:hypothetical protein B0H21DRAFT_713571 [Amylocystis lapponica]
MKDAKSQHVRYVQEARRFMLGLMPVQDFIHEFLPRDTDMTKMPPSVDAFKKIPAKPERKTDIYGHLQSPGYAELFIEVKETVAHDFFKDPPDDADRSRYQFMLDITNEEAYERAEESLGHHVAYATEACARQHRTFYLSMSLAGTFLRFIRWDRAGAIVSESFDIRAQPEFLCDFLWRFAHASLTERGHDPTLEFAAPGDEDRFREIISARVKIETGLTGEALDDAIEEHYKPGLVIIITERLLVSRPVAYPLSVAGRATRGYWAVTASDDVVFLKDSWRYLAMEKEGVTIEEMEKAGVVNIPQILIHGDVPMELRDEVPENAPMLGTSEPHGKIVAKPRFIQHTRTEEFKDRYWVCRGGQAISVTGHAHYRLVSKTVGYPLKRFVDAKELLRAAFDAYQALTSAYDKNMRLHRDISIGNIILVRETARKERRGVLFNWEFSSIINSNAARGYERTGTWNFMSARLLEVTGLVHLIQDDMESMLWVVLYCGFLWLPVQVLGASTLDDTVYDLFESSHYNATKNVSTGGHAKLLNSLTRRYTRGFKFKCVPFQEFCETMMDYHCPRDHVKVELDGQWEDPRYFEKFWSDFLDTNKDKFVGTFAEKHDNKVANAPPHGARNPFSAREASDSGLTNVEAELPSLRTSRRNTGAAAAKCSTSIRSSKGVRQTPAQTRSMARLRVAGPSAGVAYDAAQNDSAAGEPSNGRGSNGGVGGTRQSARLRSTQSTRGTDQKKAWRP